MKQKNNLEKKIKECPNLFKCYNAQWEWNCFGSYVKCKRYQTGDLTLPVKTYEQWESDNFKNYVPVR